jgi:hypothetical protein
MGYYYMTVDNSPSQPKKAIQGMLAGAWLLPNKTAEQAQQIMAPIERALRNNSHGWPDPVAVASIPLPFPDYTKAWLSLVSPESVGVELRLGSRLLDRKALETEAPKIKRLLQKANTYPKLPMLGHLIAGKGVKTVKNGIPGGSNAVNPAWRRDVYVHFVLARNWPYLNATAKEQVTKHLRDVEVPALKDLAPDTGAYLNEADPTEPNWQETFWGDNYPRLLELKRKWDPTGVFWCVPCVGHSDGWEVISDFGVEGAIGQTPGRICRVS